MNEHPEAAADRRIRKYREARTDLLIRTSPALRKAREKTATKYELKYGSLRASYLRDILREVDR